MSFKNRLQKLEAKHKPQRTALFVIHEGKASGTAWYDPRLVWEDLSKVELESLQGELASEGVEVLTINAKSVLPDGTMFDGWDDSYHSPQEIVDIYHARKRV